MLMVVLAAAPLIAQTLEGGRLYLAHCAGCHGAEGDSVAGIDFRRGHFRRVSNDNDLQRVISQGIAGTAMPPIGLAAPQAAAVAAYVRSMRAK